MSKVSQKNRRIIQKFSLFDDLYMTRYFKGFKEGAEFLIQMILNKPDLKADTVEIQQVMPNLLSKSSRLDVLAKDQNGKHYNIEFQTSLLPGLPERSRFYQGNVWKCLLQETITKILPSPMSFFFAAAMQLEKNCRCTTSP